MLSEFNKKATETTKKISNVDGQGVITEWKPVLDLAKFHSGNTLLKTEHRPGYSLNLDQVPLRELVECNPLKSTQKLALYFNTSNAQSTTTWKR